MDSPDSSASPYALLFQAASLIPVSHYLSLLVFVSILFGYNYLEFHFFEDLLLGFRGSPVSLTFNSCSDIYDGVASKCRLLHGRYLATPWLSNPHLQTAFLNFFGRPPPVNYSRRLFHASDGGTIALDWLMSSDVLEGGFHVTSTNARDDATPIVLLIPGLTSDSASAYVKHFSFNMAKHGWNVVISNHRGLGGISITSDCFYNAGWTEDAREVIRYLHHEYPKAPLFVVGTSIGANILIKYLGEDGENIPVAGAAAISSPWDLLIGDRFIKRRFLQKLYDRALASGLLGYAQLHQPLWSRLADWEGIEKSRSVRDFDMYATCYVGKFETVDTYYRRCSSASFVGNVAVPVLCISALDDPVCTREAIPWDECRANKNIVLATTQHGGHLAFFEGKSASSLWWVRAVIEFLSVLHSSPHMHRQRKTVTSVPHFVLEPSIDQGPYVNVGGDGMVAAMGNEPATNEVVEGLSEGQRIYSKSHDEIVSNMEQDERKKEETSESDWAKSVRAPVSGTEETRSHDVISCFRKCLTQFSQQNKWSIWLLAYIAIVTSWPLLGSALRLLKKKKLRNV